METNKEKFIRTTNGAKKKSDFENSFSLPYEHIVQNICDYLAEKK
jgi:hypothetical protein